MEEKNETKQEQQVSQFCDTLMKVTGAVGHLSKQGDCAFVLCSDGTMVCNRKMGSYHGALEMVLSAMLNDIKLAELFVEAAMRYSRHIQQDNHPSDELPADASESEENCDIINFS